MPIRQVVIMAPISVPSLLRLREQGYNLYGLCEGISLPVEIRNIATTAGYLRTGETKFSNPGISEVNMVQIGYWGYRWVPITKLKRVVGMRVDPDQRTEYSKKVTETVAPDQQYKTRKDKQ